MVDPRYILTIIRPSGIQKKKSILEESILNLGYMVMNRAKINGRTTYQKYIQDLHQFGYIGYTPSYNHFLGSLISMENFARISGKSEKEPGYAGE
jgi:hypothetical protein